jgi:hypothetical protein
MAFFQDGIKAVTTGGTAVVLGSGDFNWLYVMAHDDNTNPVYIGASTVVAAIDGTGRGMQVPQAKPDTTFVPLRIDGPGTLADIYVDAVTNGESVTWFGLMV